MKLVCIYHSIDLDGWMSAAIVKHWYVEHVKVGKFTALDSIEFIGYNYGQPIPDLSEYDKVIMCDISFPKDIMYLEANCSDRKLVWIDHHISAINDSKVDEFYQYDKVEGIRDAGFAACELTWKHFFPNEKMPEIVRLLGRYDCFGHKGTAEEQKVLEFQYGARQCISNYKEAYQSLIISLNEDGDIFNLKTPENKIWLQGKSIYKYLCTEAKQIYKNGFEIEFLVPKEQAPQFGFKYKFICINKERFNPINFGINYHQEGYDGAACFHYANGMWNFSLYNDNGLVDCSVIAKLYGGGGHKGASGFRISDINDITKQLNSWN